MQDLAVLVEDFDQRHDLCSGGVDQVKMVVDSFFHGGFSVGSASLCRYESQARSCLLRERSLGLAFLLPGRN
jgi:hypothetical protein